MRSALPLACLLALPAAAAPATYDEAHRLVLAGRFAEALPHLEALAADPDPAVQLRAALLAELCRAWSAGGFVLVAPSEADAPRAQRVRTTGEIARLYIDGVLYGIGSGGYFSLLGEADSTTWVVLPMLLSAGAAGGTLALLDRADAFQYGHPRTISAGLRIGLMEGVAWMSWYQAQADEGEALSDKASASLVWGLTSAGIATGALLGTHLRTTPGRAAFVESGALWSGAVAGLTAAAILGDSEGADEAFTLSAAVALNLGAGAATWLAGAFNPSADRALYLDLGGLAGGLVAGGLYLALADDQAEVRPATGLTAAGIAGGLATAWALTRHLPPDAPRTEAPRLHFGLAPQPGGGLIALQGILE